MGRPESAVYQSTYFQVTAATLSEYYKFLSQAYVCLPNHAISIFTVLKLSYTVKEHPRSISNFGMTCHVVFQGTVVPQYASLSERFYTLLLPLLHASPGFIEETGFASTTNPNGQVLLAKFKDAESINTWRVEPTHLRVERTGREKVFEEYRIRIGPCAEEARQETEGQVVMLYQRPHAVAAVGSGDGKTATYIKELLDRELLEDTVLGELNDESVYQSEKTVLWISSWKSDAAAVKIETALQRVEGDTVQRVKVERDYTKVDRRDVLGTENEEVEPADE